MVKITLEPGEIVFLSDLLQNSDYPSDLPADLQRALMLKGAVISLQQDGSQSAIDTLKFTVIHCPSPDIQQMAIDAISLLASRHPYAVETLYQLAIQQDQALAQQAIRDHKITTTKLIDQVLLFLITQDLAQYQRLDPGYELLTRIFFDETVPESQQRLLEITRKAGLTNWSAIAEAVMTDSLEAYARLISSAGTFQEDERNVMRQAISTKAAAGSESAREAVCEIFLQFEDPLAREDALQNGYTPRDMSRRALFFFLTEQWAAYEQLDFAHTLLNSIYENAAQHLRRRLLSQSRYSGQIKWLQTKSGASRQRWLKDLTDADWQLILTQLTTTQDLTGLWKLAQSAPPIWSAEILRHLHEQNFAPAETVDRDGYAKLNSLALDASRDKPQIYLKDYLKNISVDVNSLAISPGGKILAAGGSDQVIQRWQLPGGEWNSASIYGPAPQTRALCFSPDSQYLACANGDHAIRIYRLDDGKLLKTLEGHTGLVRSLVVHPDGRTLFSSSFDGTVRSWRFPHGAELQKFVQTADEIFDMALSADGHTLLSAGSDRMISVWNVASGSLLRQLSGHTATIISLAISSTGQLAASASRDKTLRIWNFNSGRQLQEINSGPQPVTAVAFHPNEQLLFSAAYTGKITIWNIASGKLILQLEHLTRPITALALTPDGNHLLCGSSDGKIAHYILEPFLLTHQSVEISRPNQAQVIQNILADSSIPDSAHPWLAFRLELIRWKERFDIEIAEPQRIQLQDFDIEID